MIPRRRLELTRFFVQQRVHDSRPRLARRRLPLYSPRSLPDPIATYGQGQSSHLLPIHLVRIIELRGSVDVGARWGFQLAC